MGAVVLSTYFFVAHPPVSMAPVSIIDIARCVFISLTTPSVPSWTYVLAIDLPFPEVHSEQGVTETFKRTESRNLYRWLLDHYLYLRFRRPGCTILLGLSPTEARKKVLWWTITPLTEGSSYSTPPNRRSFGNGRQSVGSTPGKNRPRDRRKRPYQ